MTTELVRETRNVLTARAIDLLHRGPPSNRTWAFTYSKAIALLKAARKFA
jgi:hypothetical protein